MKARKKFVKLVRKVSRKGAKRRAVTAFSKFIRERDIIKYGGWCPLCQFGKTHNPVQDCGHWQTAAWESTKWDEENATGICKQCNIAMEHDSGFKYLCIKWYIQTHGQMCWDSLVLRSHQIQKRSAGDLLEIAEMYERRLLQLRVRGLEGRDAPAIQS